MQKKYIVEGNLKHDSQSLVTGDAVLLDDIQAEPLLAIGRVKLAVEAVTPPQMPAQAVPDGFPQREPSLPAAEQILPAENPVSEPPADPGSQITPPPAPPKQPTPEQIAKDMAQLGQ